MLPLLEKENTSMRGKSALSLKKVSNTTSDQLALEADMRPNLASSPELFELTEQPNDQQAATTSPQIIGVTKKMNASSLKPYNEHVASPNTSKQSQETSRCLLTRKMLVM